MYLTGILAEGKEREGGRRGQFTAYIKPVMVLLFMILLVFLFVEVMNFQTDLEQERSEVQFQQEVRRDVQKLVDCLRVDDELSGSSFVLNASKLERFEQQYRLREPPCAEDMQYGYNVTVRESFLGAREVRRAPGGPVDVVFAIDDSGSMGRYLQAVKDNVRGFMGSMPQGSRVGMFMWAAPCQNSEEYANWEPQQEFPNRDQSEPTMGPLGGGSPDVPDIPGSDDIDLPNLNCVTDTVVELTSDPGEVEETLDSHGTTGGLEPVDGAVRFAWEGAGGEQIFDWRDGVRKILVVVATEPASNDVYTRIQYYEEAGVAWENHGIEVHPVAEKEYADEWNQMAEYGGGNFYHIEEQDFDKILADIASGSNPSAFGETTCYAPTTVREEEGSDTGNVRVAFVMDTSTSMEDYINGVRDSMQDFLDDLGPDSEAAIIEYIESYLGKQPFTGDADTLVTYLDNIDLGNDPNGNMDTPENPAVGFEEALNGLSWNEGGNGTQNGSQQAIVIMVDEGAKNCGQLMTHAEEAQRRNITVYTVLGYNDGNSFQGCQQELEQDIPNMTGGNSYSMQNIGKVMDNLGQDIGGENTHVPAGGQQLCEPTYMFGEHEGSDAEGLQQDIELRYPITIWRSKDRQNPGELVIRVRDGGLERLTGAIDSVVQQGNEQGRQVERRFRFNTRQELYSTQREVERPQDTTYQVVNADTGSPQISVKNDIVVGVDGEPVVRVETGQPSTVDFSRPEHQFTAYRGASVQAIVKNLEGDAQVDPLAVECVDGCSGRQEISLSGTGTAPGGGNSTDGNSSSGKNFLHGMERLEIGEVTVSNEEVVCAATTGDDSCTVTRAGQLSDFTLAPGTHLLGLSYDPSTNTTTVMK